MKENLPDTPNQDIDTSPDKIQEKVPIAPWYGKLQELFVDRHRDDDEDDSETKTSPTSKKSRFGKLLASIFGGIARKDEVGEPIAKTNQVYTVNQSLEADFVPFPTTETPLSTESPDRPQSYWNEDEPGIIEHQPSTISEISANNIDDEGTLRLVHEDILLDPDDTIATQPNSAPTEAVRSTESSDPIRYYGSGYESRAYLDYRVAQETRRLRWDAKHLKRQITEEAARINKPPERAQEPNLGIFLKQTIDKVPNLRNSQTEPKKPILRPEIAEIPVQFIETAPKRLLERDRSQLDMKNMPEPVERVLDKVKLAAEHDEPIEKFYELRHEIKNEELPGRAVSVGAVVAAAMKQHYINDSGVIPLASIEGLRRVVEKDSKQPTDMYVSAVKNGLYAGLALLVFATLAYLAIRAN